MFQNTELNAAHQLRFLVETLWSPKTMSLIKIPKVWVSMTAIIFCLCILWKACITWHFWATNRKLTFSWKITPLGAIPPLNPLLAARFVWHRLAAAKITLAQAAAAATVSSQQHHLQAALFPPKHTVSRRFVNKFMSHKDAFSEDHEILCQHQEVLGQC